MGSVEVLGQQAIAELDACWPCCARGRTARCQRGDHGMAEIPALLRSFESSGMPVRFESHGRACGLDPSVHLAAYRLVQESLTNAAKHADGARVRVVASWRPDSIDLEVANDLPERRAPLGGEPSGGYGLVGLRERVRLLGGTFTAGPRTTAGLSCARPCRQRGERCARSTTAAPRPTLTARRAVSIRVVLADDQALVRSGIEMLLDAEPDLEVVAALRRGPGGARRRRLRPDVAVLDVRMPVLDGVEATRQIVAARAQAVPPAVLVLTNFNLDAALYGALSAGAAGFLLKDAAPEELAHAVAVAAGKGWLDPDVTRSGDRAVLHPALGVAGTLGSSLDRSRTRGPRPPRAGPVERGDRRRALRR